MSGKIDGQNQPAFPHQKEDGTPYWGMSLRDWFAGQALAGLIASCSADQRWPETPTAARTAYNYADAMLARRSQP